MLVIDALIFLFHVQEVNVKQLLKIRKDCDILVVNLIANLEYMLLII
jgi:hypothetical protein